MSRITSGNNGITQPYKKGKHNGVDIGWHNNEEDNKVIAHSDGVVEAVVRNYTKTDKTGNSYGNYVLIRHNNVYKTRYAHLKYGSIKVKVGDKIKKGDQIGIIGATGRATARHLHFETIKNGTRIDPTPYIKSDLPIWEINKEYISLYNKFVRRTPLVANNKVLYKNITINKDKYCNDKKGYAKTRIGVPFTFTDFKKDSKGNTWGKLKTCYVCVEDSSGIQFKAS